MRELLEERDYDAITKNYGDGYTELESDSYEDIKYETLTRSKAFKKVNI